MEGITLTFTHRPFTKHHGQIELRCHRQPVELISRTHVWLTAYRDMYHISDRVVLRRSASSVDFAHRNGVI